MILNLKAKNDDIYIVNTIDAFNFKNTSIVENNLYFYEKLYYYKVQDKTSIDSTSTSFNLIIYNLDSINAFSNNPVAYYKNNTNYLEKYINTSDTTSVNLIIYHDSLVDLNFIEIQINSRFSNIFLIDDFIFYILNKNNNTLGFNGLYITTTDMKNLFNYVFFTIYSLKLNIKNSKIINAILNANTVDDIINKINLYYSILTGLPKIPKLSILNDSDTAMQVYTNMVVSGNINSPIIEQNSLLNVDKTDLDFKIFQSLFRFDL